MSKTDLQELRPRLYRALREGAQVDEQLAQALGLPEEAEDSEVAKALVRRLSALASQRVAFATGDHVADQGGREDSRVFDNRASYLMRLATDTDERGTDLRRLDDLRTLVAVVYAGTLRQRRAAVLRLGELLRDPKPLPGDQVRDVIDTLVHLRKFEIAYELSLVCGALPGAEGRRARAGRKEWEQIVESVTHDIRAYWEGERPEEPLTNLHADQQVQLLVRTRDLPDEVIQHLGALIEGSAGPTALEDRVQLTAALLNAGDPRLVPSLRAALDVGEAELTRPAARALGRIDDPRVHPILKGAFERAVRAETKLALAGALGMVGDRRGHGYVREMLGSDDPRHAALALHALDSLGTTEDVQAVTIALERSEPEVLVAAVRTLGRIGDSRSLTPLERLRVRTDRSALRAEIEEARTAVLSRMELLGEEAPTGDTGEQAIDTKKMAALTKRDPAVIRLRAHWSVFVGYLWRTMGAYRKAVGRFEMAAALRPSWARPVLAVALVYARHGKYPQALAAFRRALEIDRDYVEAHHSAPRHLAQSFLRRAEAMEMDGRMDIAFGLLEEALSLDLRKAPSGLRFALSQRHEVLRAKNV